MSEYDADATDEMSDSEFDSFLDAEDAAAESEINDQDRAELAAEDDSPADLHAGLALSDADRDDLGGVDEDVPEEVPQLTADQIELDGFRKERDLRAKTFGERCEDMDRPRSFGEIRAAAVWSQHQEAERRESVRAVSADAESENEARAIAGVARFMAAEDADEGPGYISGPGSEPDHDDAAERRRAAMDRWTDFCNDTDS